MDEQPIATTSERSDAELITAVRAGDREAYGVLWGRHEAAARNLARQIAKSNDVDELVSESFYRVLRALDGGGGPDGAFRPYLLSTLRRVNIDAGRGYYQRVSLTDDDTALEGEPGVSAADITIEQGEQTAAWLAWASLPDSSRTLLWHLIVEEETPTAIAPLMGTTPNGVSSRAVRAKERLRQAFLQQHVRMADTEKCEWTRLRVGEYVRDALSNREHSAVDAHLSECKRCKAVVAEIADVNQSLKVLVAPIILGGAAAAAGYLHAAGASSGLHFVGLGQLRRLIRPSVVAGAATVVAVAGIAAGLLAANQGGHHKAKAAPPPPSSSSVRVAPPAPPSRPPAHAAKPQPKPKPPVGPSPTTPGPTPSTPKPTPTPTPTSSHNPTPAPTPSHSPTPPAPPPSTPPSSSPKPPPAPPIVQAYASVRVYRSFDITHGTLRVSVPSGWRISDIHEDNLGLFDRCTITSTTTASCTLSAGLPFSHRDFTVTASGPWSDPPPVLHAQYVDDIGNSTERDYELKRA